MANSSDPRGFFAAERTLMAAERTVLAWNRTSLALMGFGFLIERFGLYEIPGVTTNSVPIDRIASFLLGLLFIFLGISVAILSIFQYRSILVSIKKEIPTAYSINAVIIPNGVMSIFGIFLIVIMMVTFFLPG